MNRKPATKPKDKPATKRKPPGKRGPVSDAKAIAAIEALDIDWARATRHALVALSEYIVDAVQRGTLDPLVAVGAFRALSSAVNDRDAVVEPPPNKP